MFLVFAYHATWFGLLEVGVEIFAPMRTSSHRDFEVPDLNWSREKFDVFFLSSRVAGSEWLSPVFEVERRDLLGCATDAHTRTHTHTHTHLDSDSKFR